MTREQVERDRCAAELTGENSPEMKLQILMGWLDWSAEEWLLTHPKYEMEAKKHDK